jgi:hypothetical protein
MLLTGIKLISAIINTTAFYAVAFLTMTLLGCGLTGGPRPRVGYLPTATFGIVFTDPEHLGNHSYGFGLFEAGGIVYTCRAGHIDLDHVRGCADMTRHLVNKIRNTLSRQADGFSFSASGELSRHKVIFTYPQNWDTNPKKEQIIEEISFSTAPYLAYYATIWHEILTWFGVHFVGFEPEFNSAFSWEDVYSDLIGAKLGAQAARDPNYSYDQAMTIALKKQLDELQVQPKATAYHASDKVRYIWYTGNFIPDVKMRNFDIGLDGYVTPTLVPGIAVCHSQPLSMPVPNLDILKKHGFAISHEVKPNVLEQGRIYKAAGSKRIFPQKHYPILLEYMKKDALKRGYKYDE